MKKVLAISGGVDSMFLLWKYRNDKTAVVAHFNHGTRPSADEDAKFVERKAKEYGLPFYIAKANLGPEVSEAEARKARYEFLEKVAQEVDGEICTAHHLNDLCETIAINIARGTGWRGLAPFYNKKIKRPFLDVPKSNIHKMAAENGLEFRQDPTNNDSVYFRNRLREKSDFLDEKALQKIGLLYKRQVEIRDEVEKILELLISKDELYQREWFDKIEDEIAIELLRYVVSKKDISATRPQLYDFLNAIRTYAPRKKFNLPGGKFATIYKDYFVL